MTLNHYQAGFRRMLVDMHIPDWDPRFLAQYDPKRMADLYEQANVTSVMLYCKSHVGLCNWPTKVGKMHDGLGGRDIVGELVAELEGRGIATCAYTSVVFENWAVETHPEWRQRRQDGFDAQDYVRYGFACQNHPEYVDYERDLIEELLTSYRFDAIFLDMAFWPLQCGCPHCLDRFRAETGYDDQPWTIDWCDPHWVAWQSARERWADEFVGSLATHIREVSPGIAVTHNLAPGLQSYEIAQPLAGSRHDDFVAGDLYGDRYEQLLVTRLSLHLSESRPAEFMTSRCVNLLDHVQIKREAEMEMAALAASALSSAFLFIDAIDPAGTANPGVFERIGRIFATTEPYEPFLGGEPVEDVAVYFSVDSQMDLADNGTELSKIGQADTEYPHMQSAKGVCRALQRQHIPFGVIVRKQLDRLSDWPVIVLSNIQRMDDDEIAAFRAYVDRGGCLYASRWSSLVDTTGGRRDGFGLADVFGCDVEADEQGRIVYFKPTESSAGVIAPQDYLSVRADSRPYKGVPRLAERAAGEVLATLTVPYGYPKRGSVKDHEWSSIHSSPPWTDTEIPTIVANRVGEGRVVYSAAALETDDTEADEALFVALIRDLLGPTASASADTHPAVWFSVFDQADRSRQVATFLNYQGDLPPVAVPATFSLRPPSGRRFTGATLAPDGHDVECTIDADGALHGSLPVIDRLAMVIATYE